MKNIVTKNYSTDGGDTLVIGGKLVIEEGAEVLDFSAGKDQVHRAAVNQEESTATAVAGLKNDFNALLKKLKNAGVMTPDAWNVSVLACPTPVSMPTAETAANSGHTTVAIDDNGITITLDCKVSELADADHGETWGEHKWLGFGVRTGLDDVTGIRFTDDTGAEVTLAASDAAEATALGLSAGDFVIYIKAEDPAYLTGEKHFTLWADGYAETKFTMSIAEPPVTA